MEFMCSLFEYFRLLGIKLKHMLILGCMTFVFIVLLVTLWNYCASGDRNDSEAVEYTKPSDVKTVVAREIRPGLILVQGYPTQEETYRIVAEYDAMQTGGKKIPTYGAAGESVQPTNMTSYYYQQPTESIIYPVAPSAPDGATDRLLGHSSRPPPYVMDQTTLLR